MREIWCGLELLLLGWGGRGGGIGVRVEVQVQTHLDQVPIVDVVGWGGSVGNGVCVCWIYAQYRWLVGLLSFLARGFLPESFPPNLSQLLHFSSVCRGGRSSWGGVIVRDGVGGGGGDGRV